MKRVIFLITVIFVITNTVFAQTENYQTAINKLLEDYNSDKYEAIFNSFSDEMQQALPLTTTKQFLTGLKMQFGNIKNTEFVDYTPEMYAIYKTEFEKTVLDINISLDQQNRIDGFLIKPYQKNVEDNKAINNLNSYPKGVAETLFSYSKDFPNRTQLSVAVIQDGKVNYYGIIKENNTIKPIMNRDKVFEIGSITKVFTSTVLASLVIDKKIELTDEINSYYPFVFKDNIKLSFESLANHTSGLPRLPENMDLSDAANPYKNYGKNEINEYLKNFLTLENQQKESYSNLGSGLLGYTLGLSQKTDFQKLLQKRVFDKYKMNNSFVTAQNLEYRLIKGQDPEGQITSNWEFDVLFGAGGILSTTEDLIKFVQAHFNPKNKELELTRKPTFEIDESTKIGLGWYILKLSDDKEVIWHNGGTGGYSSSMIIDIDKKKAVVVLSNVSTFHPKNGNIDKISFQLINAD